jgi:hypothetical protein
MNSDGERPLEFWRPQDVWILRNETISGFATPANSTVVGEGQSLASSLISEISMNTGGR